MPPPDKRSKFEDNAQDVLDYINSLGREFTILSFIHTGTSINIEYIEFGTSEKLTMLSLDDRTAVADFIAALTSYDGIK